MRTNEVVEASSNCSQPANLKCNSKLLILPLNLLDNGELMPQRCYVPQQLAEQLQLSGKWCKCDLDNGQYAICRVFPRASSETCGFLDSTVASTAFKESQQSWATLKPLIVQNQVEQIKCIVSINEQLLQQALVSLEQLHHVVSIFLRHLKLFKGCQVRHRRLLHLGIAHIDIVAASSAADDSCFEHCENTQLIIEDVRLAMPPILTPLNAYEADCFEAPLQSLAQLLHAAQKPQFKRLPLNALIVGAMGTGKSTLLAELLRRQRCNCFYMTASELLRSPPGETERQLRSIFTAAQTFVEALKPKQPLLILIEDLELLCPAKADGNAQRIAAQLYSLIDALPVRCPGVLCLASSSAPESIAAPARRAGRFGYEINIELLNQVQRKDLFAALWETQQQEEQLTPALLDYVAQQTQGFVVADLQLLLRRLQQQLLKHDIAFEQLLMETLEQCRPSAARASDVRVLKLNSVGFEAIGGMDQLKRTLQVSILAALQQSAAHARFGLTMPKGVLLYGPPGCAKTSMAKCLAKEAGMTFIASSAAEVYSPYVGCAERFITQIFNTARKNAPCLIFLDEIDALVGRRSLSGGSGSVQLRILSTLLTEMDGIVSSSQQQHILVVAATNRPDMLDDALLRPGRFDKLIHVPAPDLPSRLSILQLHAKRMPFHPALDLEQLAERTERYSGADLCNLCNEAALEAFQRDVDASQIELQDFDKVLERLKSSLSQSQIDSYYKFATNFV